MVLKFKMKDDTPPVNLSLSLSSIPSPPPPPISISTPLYLSPQLTSFSHNYASPNTSEWSTNHPNHVPNYVGMNPMPHWCSSSNKNQNLINPDLRLGPCPKSNPNRHPLFRFDSDRNKNENKIFSALLLGLEKTHEPSGVNSIVPPKSSSAQWFGSRISSGSNRVEENETSGLTLNPNLVEPVSKNELVRVESVKGKLSLVQPLSKDKLVLVQPVSKNELKEPDEAVEKKQNQLDLIRKGKSKVEVPSPLKAKGSGEINNAAGEGEGEGERDGSGEKEVEEEVETERSDEDEEPITEIAKSWNLRPRKPATKPEDKVNIGSSGGGRSRRGVASARVSKPRSAKSRVPPSSEKPVVKEKREFVLTLTKEEIERDFTLMIGEKPPKKPIRRPKIVQKNLDVLFPGMYLTNVTPEKYGVNDNPPPLKY